MAQKKHELRPIAATAEERKKMLGEKKKTSWAHFAHEKKSEDPCGKDTAPTPQKACFWSLRSLAFLDAEYL